MSRFTFRLVLFTAVVLTAPAARPLEVPEELQKLSQAYLASGSETDRRRLTAYVNAATGELGALARFALGVGEHQAERYREAAAELGAATAGLPELADYATYFRGRSLARAEEFGGAASALDDFGARFKGSRLQPLAAQVRAESLIRDQRLDEARQSLSGDDAPVPSPSRDYLLGRVFELQGSPLRAVESYRRGYYFHPFSEEAELGEQRLDALRQSLGGQYPDAPAEWRLERAEKLLAGGQASRAAAEYRRAWDGLRGPELSQAQVRYGVALYRALQTSAAYDWLRNLTVSSAAFDSERLYYLGECARRKGLVQEYEARAEELARKDPTSRWTHEAFFSIGNYYLLRNEGEAYRRYYAKAAAADPDGQWAEKASWKVCWEAYLRRDPDTPQLLRSFVAKYPGASQTAGALYWLGRLEEKAGRPDSARALYSAVEQSFPHYYYGYLSAARIEMIGPPRDPAAVERWTKGFPDVRRVAPAPTVATLNRLERSRTLFQLGLGELAEQELAAADWRPADSHLVGLELYQQLADRGLHGRALRYMKRYGYGYLRLPFEALPREAWEALFPMPWADAVHDAARQRNLDPYLVAALIRQESEFDPKAVSRAGAIGLMQLMPATGRDLARRQGIPRFSTANLKTPEISLRLGTYHLKTVLDQFETNLELALAAYNAGESRALEWITWGQFEEAGEFAETIPFTETRGYVQAVLRNREVYRRLHGSGDTLAQAVTRPAGASAH